MHVHIFHFMFKLRGITSQSIWIESNTSSLQSNSSCSINSLNSLFLFWNLILRFYYEKNRENSWYCYTGAYIFISFYLKCLVLLVVFSRLENSIYALLIFAYFSVYDIYNFSLSLYFADLSVLWICFMIKIDKWIKLVSYALK